MWMRRHPTSASSVVALLTSAASTRASYTGAPASTVAFSSLPLHRHIRPLRQEIHHNVPPRRPASVIGSRNNLTRQRMSFFGGAAEGIRRIDRDAMSQIIEDVANSSREESGYLIIDVRGHDEVRDTGKLDAVVETLPLPYIAQGALVMEEGEFKEAFGFEKPALDETIVFTCKAGIRSQQAGQLAKMAGYTDVLDYAGGANEWFS